MNKRWLVFALTKKTTEKFDISGITTIGGSQSSGHVIDGLKQKDEYAILSPTDNGIIIHSLKGKEKVFQVSAYKHFEVLDLTILVLPDTSNKAFLDKEKSHNRFVDDMSHLLVSFSSTKNFNQSLHLLFESLLTQLEMEKGLLITKNENGEFLPVIEKNINLDEPWLSETLVQQTLHASEPVIISNVIGSEFEKSKSLMATGFLSVMAWPLSVRGEKLGVLLVGSDRPHSGLTPEQNTQAQAYIQLAAIMLKFYLRDLSLKREINLLRESHLNRGCPIITNYKPLEETIQLGSQVAESNLSLLIHGETGTGKEVMARWIHKQSQRSGKFIAINCSSIPENLLESLLFGHKKGSFTGAHKDQQGKFELAHGGTLFLDEIGDLPGTLQAKLLRAIQEKKVEPLGASKEIPVDVRLISASHKNLPEQIKGGQFREDLYYRLADVTLQLPPLRERPNDIELIVSQVLKSEGMNKSLSQQAWYWLKSQNWPGNVRELLSAVKRASVLAAGEEIRKEHFLMGAPQSLSNIPEKAWLGGETLEEAKLEFVKDKVHKALKLSDNKRTQAAKLLGVTPRTLFRYLEDWNEPKL